MCHTFIILLRAGPQNIARLKSGCSVKMFPSPALELHLVKNSKRSSVTIAHALYLQKWCSLTNMRWRQNGDCIEQQSLYDLKNCSPPITIFEILLALCHIKKMEYPESRQTVHKNVGVDMSTGLLR